VPGLGSTLKLGWGGAIFPVLAFGVFSLLIVFTTPFSIVTDRCTGYHPSGARGGHRLYFQRQIYACILIIIPLLPAFFNRSGTIVMFSQK
jgi:hypothetical protein